MICMRLPSGAEEFLLISGCSAPEHNLSPFPQQAFKGASP